jgi:hypothetical protein
MQAIIVKYLPATNTKPSRYKAYCNAGSITQSCGHYCDTSDNADRRMIAEALQQKLGWIGPRYGHLIEAGLPDGKCVYVLSLSDDMAGKIIPPSMLAA